MMPVKIFRASIFKNVFLYALDTYRYTTTQFFLYTIATQQKLATRWIHGYTIRKRLISGTHTIFIKNFYEILRAAVNPYVTLPDNIHLLNTAYFCENLIKYRLFIKVLKQLFLPKIYSNIRNNPYVATNNFLKTAENRHHCPCACQVICVFVANYHQKQKIYILATQ